MPSPIKNLVVLMLENRSFDHMLGFLKYDDPTKKIDGLIGTESCFSADEGPDILVSRNAGDVNDLSPDPSHDFNEVTLQLYSNGLAQGADMKGFVLSYNDVCRDPIHARNVMKCFTPESLPVLSTLAKSYGVSDRWFSSVPGSTIPNRLFVHGASSCGSVNQDAIDAPFMLKTIYESMGGATIHDFRIYTSGASILLANKYLLRHQGKFASYDATFEDDALGGHLPAYTFIEPAYDDDGNGLFASSQHPDFPVDRGESLIADIYNILVQSPQWSDTLFLILYDEHGGIYDHVVPPTLTPLAQNAGLSPIPVARNGFDFTRLGVRVPAVFISPRIKPGTIFHDRDFEHSSVVATVRKLFCPGTQPLSWREAQANTFEDVLEIEGKAIRKDVVKLKPIIAAPLQINAAAEVRKATELSILMAKAMHYSLTTSGVKLSKDIATLTTAAEVSKYLHETQKLVLAGGR